MAPVYMRHPTVFPPGSGLLLFTLMIVVAGQLHAARSLLMLLVAVNETVVRVMLYGFLGLQQNCWMCLLGSVLANPFLCLAVFSLKTRS